jgi:predicted RNA-binding protein YlqC (UPF0109 family)
MVKQLIEYIVKQLVESPDVVTVTLNDEKQVLEVRVAKSDLGKVIGKEGQTVRAMRALVDAIGSDNIKDIILTAIE